MNSRARAVLSTVAMGGSILFGAATVVGGIAAGKDFNAAAHSTNLKEDTAAVVSCTEKRSHNQPCTGAETDRTLAFLGASRTAARGFAETAGTVLAGAAAVVLWKKSKPSAP
jgi:hypothetical protein